MYSSSFDFTLVTSWFSVSSIFGLIGSLTALLLGSMALYRSSRIVDKLASLKLVPKSNVLPPSIRASSSADTEYHVNARKRIDALPSVRYLREQCANQTMSNQHDKLNYLELAPRKIQKQMLPPEQVAEHLTLTTLYGVDKLTEWPVFRIRVNGPSSESDPGIVSTVVASDSTNDSHTTHVLYFHLGAALCGHRHVVHGGLLATLVDELFAIQVWHEMGAAFTAQLTVDYRRPVLSNQVIRGRTWTVSKEGRKVWVRALLEGIEGPEENNALAVEKAAQMPATEEVAKRGEILVEARALFVLPREGVSKAAAAAAAATSSSK